MAAVTVFTTSSSRDSKRWAGRHCTRIYGLSCGLLGALGQDEIRARVLANRICPAFAGQACSRPVTRRCDLFRHLSLQPMVGIEEFVRLLVSYAATAIDTKSRSFFQTAHATRAILLATATAALFVPTLRSS